MNEKKRPNDRGLVVKITPNAGHNEITGWCDGAIRIKIAAPPEKGKANQELISFLSRALGVKKSAIQIIKGQTDRDKIIAIEGMSRGEAMDKLTG